jgi:DNA-binding Lrp family transcriptional regulator
MHQRDLGCVSGAAEHRLPKESAGNADSVKTSDKFSVLPCLNRVGESLAMEQNIALDDGVVDPGLRPVRAFTYDSLEIRVIRDFEELFLERSAQPAGNVKSVQGNDASRIGRKPADLAVSHAHGKHAGAVGIEQQLWIEFCQVKSTLFVDGIMRTKTAADNSVFSCHPFLMPPATALPVEHTDPINAQILSVSEDMISGFRQEPFQEIARVSGVELGVVLERVRAMLEAGVIRRVRQTLLATKLAHGALTAWKVPAEKLDEAFDFMFKEDPFSGHVVTRSTDREISGAAYRLWTTLKVPQGESLEEHADVLKRLTGAESYKLMPANGIFALGVGHVRRKSTEIGAKSEAPAVMNTTTVVDLEPIEWKILLALKGELTSEEICARPWDRRAEAAGVSLDEFFRIAAELDKKKVIGRFSTFLEHAKPSKTGVRVTRFNGLFHWAVPEGMEQRAGSEIGRHDILTHCYWREGGPEFGNVNIMAVLHGTDKDIVLKHKAAIDEHLVTVQIPVNYTNVFWGGRTEIKPSEISPIVYKEWHARHAQS